MPVAAKFENAIGAFEVVASGMSVGAEVRGVDLSLPVPADIAAAMLDAWHQHLVLLFRDQSLTPDQYLAAANVFGKPQPGANRAYYDAVGKSNPYDTLGRPEITLMT